jgi:hypothetical protein
MHVVTILHSGGDFTSILLTGQEVTSGAFGEISVVLDTAAGLSELTAGDGIKLKKSY